MGQRAGHVSTPIHLHDSGETGYMEGLARKSGRFPSV